MVMKMTPLAEPGRCRQVTRPETVARAPDAVVRTESAKEVTAGKRLYGLVEGDLAYAYDMAAVGQPLQAHTSARLSRVRQTS